MLHNILYFKINLKWLIFEYNVRTILKLKIFISRDTFIAIVSGNMREYKCLDFHITFIFEIWENLFNLREYT